eukprot:4964615-Pyramimonas_sp.AAC.1
MQKRGFCQDVATEMHARARHAAGTPQGNLQHTGHKSAPTRIIMWSHLRDLYETSACFWCVGGARFA